jgi:hypothetical protein
MKTQHKLRIALMAAIAACCFACSGTRYANTGTASDRTGDNGATNGNGKAPDVNTHDFKY